jgi:hypothetical protein
MALGLTAMAFVLERKQGLIYRSYVAGNKQTLAGCSSWEDNTSSFDTGIYFLEACFSRNGWS